MKKLINEYKNIKQLSADSIYPAEPSSVRLRTVFISSPMASIDSADYPTFQQSMLRIQRGLKEHCKAKRVFYPGMHITRQESFEGKQLAIQENFKRIKESEYLFVVYPAKLSSSVLAEIGYAIALNKKIIVFVRNRFDLPYILQEADIAIGSFSTYTYSTVDDILITLEKNGRAFLS